MSKLLYTKIIETPSVETKRDFSVPKVKPVTVGVCLSVLTAILLVIQAMRPDPQVGSGHIDSPDSGAYQEQVLLIPPISNDEARHSQARGGSFKLLGPQLLLRPKDLGHLPPGSMLWATLLNGASNGLVRAEVSKGLYVGGETKIPAGAILVGQGNSTEERLFIRFSQVVFKDGSIGNLDAEACDKSDKIVGLKGSKVGTKALNVAGSIGLGFVGGFSEALQDTEGQYGAVIRKPTLKNALLNATATTALEQSKDLMSVLKNRVPLIEVPEGTELCVITGGTR